MSDVGTNSKVDAFIESAEKWREEFIELRRIILGCGLGEELKWGVPCYTFEAGNVVLMHGFKEYCAVLFVKGALLKDEQGILVQQTKNVQAGRQIRFTGVRQITDAEAVLKAYIREAVEIEKAGLEVDFKKGSEYALPEELQSRFADMPALKTAFEALTPGRQRAYILYFSAPKQAKTRADRVERNVQRILDKKGLDD